LFFIKKISLKFNAENNFFHLSRKHGNNGEIDPLGMYGGSNESSQRTE